MKKKIFRLILLCVITFALPISIQQVKAEHHAVMKVKPSHSTAVYKSNSKNSQKLFHTTANQNVIVHNVAKGGWSYIQDGTRFGYIASSSLDTVKPYRAITTAKDTLIRSMPTFDQKPIHTLQKNEFINAFHYNKQWSIVEYDDKYGYVPASRIQKVNIKNGKYYSGVITKQKRVALTFDDGPNIIYTPKVLNILKKYNVKATFFVTGTNVKRSPQIAKQIVTAGHEIGNHSNSHPKLTKLSATRVSQELTAANNAIQQATGNMPTVFRPPYGAYNSTIIKLAKMPTIMWSIDTLDWKHKNPKKVLQSVKNNVKNGSIILMHDTNTGSVNGLESIIQYLQKNGYEMVTVTEILTPIQ